MGDDRPQGTFGDGIAGTVIGRPWRVVAVLAVGIATGLLLERTVVAVVGRLQGLLVAVLVSLFLSFAIEPAVQRLVRRGVRRGFATALVFIVATVGILGFFASMVPLVAGQIERLADNGPQIVEQLTRNAGSLPFGLGETVAEWLREGTLEERVSELGGRLAQGLVGFGATIAQAVIVAFVTFYMVADGPRLRRTVLRRLRPERQQRLLTVWELAIEKTGNYVYLRLIVAIVSAVFHSAAFQLIGLDYAIALGVWVGVVSSLIPVVGTYLGGSLPLVIALASRHPIDAVWVLVAVVVYQQIENIIIAPRMSKRTMKLHPAVAFMAVLSGAALLGAVGALLALPVVAIVSGIVSAAGETHEVVAHDLVADEPPPEEAEESADPASPVPRVR